MFIKKLTYVINSIDLLHQKTRVYISLVINMITSRHCVFPKNWLKQSLLSGEKT